MHKTQTEHGVWPIQADRAEQMWLQGTVCLYFTHNSVTIHFIYIYFEGEFTELILTKIIQPVICVHYW